VTAVSSSPPAIPGYTLGTELGRGGMGTVWSAVEDATGDAVAVKVFTGAGDAATLRAEARRASAVAHPNVVRVRAHGGDGDLAWIAMDRVAGRDLGRYVRETGPLPPAEAARVVAEAADALAAVHAAGLVHRDVKPGNVLLDESGPAPTARLADFGVAARVPPSEGLTEASEWARTAEPSSAPAGTYAYMAPEQWRGEPATVRGDVYGLGGVLYTALTGEPPHPGESLPELAYAVVVGAPPRARDRVPDLPPAYDEVLAAALAGDPEHRVSSAAGLAAALRAVIAGRPPALPRPGADRGRRRRAAAVAALLAAAVALATLVWHPWSAHGGTGGRPLRRVVCATDLELRDAPRGVQTGTLRHGDVVSVLRRDHSQRWAYVRTGDGHRGWVLGTWVRPSCPAPTPG
jgi:serine/threonine protein kinase